MNFNNLNTNQKWFVGLLAAAVVLCGVFGLSAASFQMGRMSSGRQQGYMMQAPAAPAAPAAPQYQNDQPMPGMRGNRGFNNGPMMMGGNQRGGMGFGIFGIIGGFFRLIFTLAFIGFIFFLVRRFVFGRRGWGPWGWKGGPSTWNNGVPPHVEEWHRRMHEAAANPAPAAPAAPSADAPVAPSTDAPTTPTTPTSTDEGKLV